MNKLLNQMLIQANIYLKIKRSNRLLKSKHLFVKAFWISKIRKNNELLH